MWIWHVRHTLALTCAKNHLLIFSSFLDIWKNVEWPRFFDHPVYSRDLRSFEIRFDSKVMGRFANFRIGRACPLLAVVKRLKPLTVLSGTVYRLTSSMSDHKPVLINVFEDWNEESGVPHISFLFDSRFDSHTHLLYLAARRLDQHETQYICSVQFSSVCWSHAAVKMTEWQNKYVGNGKRLKGTRVH